MHSPEIIFEFVVIDGHFAVEGHLSTHPEIKAECILDGIKIPDERLKNACEDVRDRLIWKYKSEKF